MSDKAGKLRHDNLFREKRKRYGIFFAAMLDKGVKIDTRFFQSGRCAGLHSSKLKPKRFQMGREAIRCKFAGSPGFERIKPDMNQAA